MKKVLFFFIAIFALYACKPQVPDDYIQPGEMEDILYDYHVSQSMAREGMAENSTPSSMLQIAYRAAVLKKHGVSEAEFDSSLVYYMRHTARLQSIYENLAKRLTAEAQSLGASTSDINRFGALTAEGDTANIWLGDKSVVLSPYAPYNCSSFSLKADSAFHKGDRIMLSFRTQFIFQDGVRDGVAYLAVVYGNDSVGIQSRHLSSNTQQSLQVSDDKRLGIKEVKGFFFLSPGQLQSMTTLKLMYVTDIALIRMHRKPEPKKEVKEPDSLKQIQPVDTLKRIQATDTLKKLSAPADIKQTPRNRKIQPLKKKPLRPLTKKPLMPAVKPKQ